MKIIDAIVKVDNLKHNTYSQEDKVKWLSNVDAMIKRLIIDTHEGAGAVFFGGYDSGADMNTFLLAPEPYDELYLRYLEMRIDYANGEYDKYNNSSEMFNAAYQAYANYYNRTHMPKGTKMKYF